MTDLASFVFTLTASNDTMLPANPGRILHAAFLKWLGRVHPDLAAHLHKANARRPFAISGLHGEMGRSSGRLLLRKSTTAWYRITGMESDFIERMLNVAGQLGHGPEPDDPTLRPGQMLQTPQQHIAARMTSFAELAAGVQKQSEKGELANDVALRFCSPTCFIQNTLSLPLPVPSFVFGNLTNQWQLASPFPLPVEDVQHFVDSIYLAEASIKTHLVDLAKYKRTGFSGYTRFALHPALPINYRQALHLLGRFAYFSGVGAETTNGMGEVTEANARQTARENSLANNLTDEQEAE